MNPTTFKVQRSSSIGGMTLYPGFETGGYVRDNRHLVRASYFAVPVRFHWAS